MSSSQQQLDHVDHIALSATSALVTFQSLGAHGMYVNPARANPDMYEKYINRILPAEMRDYSTSSAICVMFGVATRSSVQQSRMTGNSKYIKELAITPISEEFERAIAFYAEVLGDPIYVGTFNGNVTFGTKQTANAAAPAYAGASGERSLFNR